MQLSDSGAAEAAAPADDLRADLEAAFEAPSAAPGIGHNNGPEIEREAPQRDERGRFAGKTATEEAASEEAPEVEQETTDQPETQTEEAAQPPIPAPASWSAAEKAHWDKLPREAQDAILRRESDVQKGFQQRAEEAKAYEPLRLAIQPHANRLAQTGRNPAEIVKQLLDVHAGLEASPYEVFPVIARMYGIDLNRIVSPSNGAQAAYDDGSNPVVAHLNQTVQQLQDRLRQIEGLTTQQQQAQAAAQHAQAEKAFTDFTARAPTDFPHFEAVRMEMGRLIEKGICDTLEEAYKKAVRLNDEVFAKVEADRKKAEDAERARKAQAAAAEAKKRAVSVKPNPSTAPVAANSADSLRAELERAFAG